MLHHGLPENNSGIGSKCYLDELLTEGTAPARDYLEDDDAFIECRNRLFNLVTANRYTLEAASSSDLGSMVDQLDRIETYSPTKLKDSQTLQPEVFRKIAKEAREAPVGKERMTGVRPPMQYPSTMKRRQHTPEELSIAARRAGLDLKYVVYYHWHPFPPRYEKAFPILFNKVGFLMQPLGYTPLGSTSCSAFVAVLEKRRR